MTTERALGAMARALEARGRPFALVGGLAVSVRGEVRFTRDVDLAIAIDDDTAVERLVRDLAADGFLPVAIVEHEKAGRISTVRLRGPDGVVVDLLCASTGIESEIVSAAERLAVFGSDSVPVALAEDLLAMKVLSMSRDRLQDTLDALGLLAIAKPDLSRVRARLRLIDERGFGRDQDLEAKLAGLTRSEG